MQRKLSKPTDQRLALLQNQVSYLLWNGKLHTTIARAKEVQKLADNYITLAIKTYEDTVTVKKTKVVKGKDTTVEVVNDGVRKLAARRKLMSKLNDLHEVQGVKESRTAFKIRTADVKHPLIEKMFNEYAPKYDKRNKEGNCAGGYTTIHKLGPRLGDAAEMAIVEVL